MFGRIAYYLFLASLGTRVRHLVAGKLLKALLWIARILYSLKYLLRIRPA